MVGQYFKRRREAVEIALVGSSGIGLALMTVFLHTTLGYVIVLHMLASLHHMHFFRVASSFQKFPFQCHRLALGPSSCYRPRTVDFYSWFLLQIGISLPSPEESYSPFEKPTKEGTVFFVCFFFLFFQKRNQFLRFKIIVTLCAVLEQIKEKNKHEEKPPFFDFTSLKSRTIQTIMVSTASIAAGLYTPLIYLVSSHFDFIGSGISAISISVLKHNRATKQRKFRAEIPPCGCKYIWDLPGHWDVQQLASLSFVNLLNAKSDDSISVK